MIAELFKQFLEREKVKRATDLEHDERHKDDEKPAEVKHVHPEDEEAKNWSDKILYFS